MGEGWSFKNAMVKSQGNYKLDFQKNWFSFDFKVFFVPVHFCFHARLKVVFVAF